MLILLPCPECGFPAEVIDRFTLNSTNGPADHLALRCAGGHHFRMLVELLPALSQQQLRAQESAPTPSDALTSSPEPWAGNRPRRQW